jgi:transcriptional regulator NrdR family protein
MKCPTCGAWTTIKESRESTIFGYTRRRECGNQHRFTTQERVVPEDAIKQYQRLHILKVAKKKVKK